MVACCQIWSIFLAGLRSAIDGFSPARSLPTARVLQRLTLLSRERLAAWGLEAGDTLSSLKTVIVLFFTVCSVCAAHFGIEDGKKYS